MRVVPRENEAINETWIADRDRFSYEGVYSDDRLLRPLVRQGDGSWREVPTGSSALAGGRGLLKARRGTPEGLGLLAHPSSTLEELYLLARLAEGLGSAQHRSSPAAARFPRPGRRRAASRRSALRIAAHRCSSTALLVVGSQPAPRGADPGAPRAQGRAARARRSASSIRRASPICSRWRSYLVAPAAGDGRARWPRCCGRRCGDAAAPAAVVAAARGGVRVERCAPRHRRRRSRPARSARCGSARWRCAAAALQRPARAGRCTGAAHRRYARRARRGRQRRRRLSRRCAAAPRGRRRRACAAPGSTRARCSSEPLRAYLLLALRALGRCARAGGAARRWRSAELRGRDHAVRERGDAARRARAAAGGHLRRDLRHLRQLRRALAEPDRRGRAARASRARPGRSCACSATCCDLVRLRLPVLRGGARSRELRARRVTRHAGYRSATRAGHRPLGAAPTPSR